MLRDDIYQTTLNSEITFSGVGLHSGKEISVRISPAYANTGIRFKRGDIPSSEYVKITPFNVYSTQLATSIKCGDFPISTVEHLMAALYGMGVDNAFVEVYGQEIPILDGSSLPYVKMIKEVGIKALSKKRKFLKLRKKMVIEKDGKLIEMLPSRFMKITTHIEFDNPFIGYQKVFVNITPETFANELAPARTFGFKNDIEKLWSLGLAKGGSMENAILIDNDRVINQEGLRMHDELVRHKALDLLGDISLIGYRFFGHVRSYKSGHLMNNIFARSLLVSTDLYTVEELDEKVAIDGFELKPEAVAAL
ncbi:MAG: UDP-3-O-acyl-N-acetylglucosamine deacetylase [Calditerrivibrio sp.]|nr:UDP-3-O-acyl-N-acetylglucosamine deacetylase [Calditerrivibrio sp.]MCA1933439.1 UDP-3-O-acyl-N-acetylglucosamine deacetylase [Calditerrivibrio sp.]MCA1980716.1 UDP-3-O-acyl-N-acetylglucosamine deacetylase [Calditerrivibrio sp.]